MKNDPLNIYTSNISVLNVYHRLINQETRDRPNALVPFFAQFKNNVRMAWCMLDVNRTPAEGDRGYRIKNTRACVFILRRCSLIPKIFLTTRVFDLIRVSHISSICVCVFVVMILSCLYFEYLCTWTVHFAAKYNGWYSKWSNVDSHFINRTRTHTVQPSLRAFNL